jgi:hypothetical protein
MYKLPKKIKKSTGMTTTSGGEGVITTGMGSYPKTRKKKKSIKKLEIEKEDE